MLCSGLAVPKTAPTQVFLEPHPCRLAFLQPSDGSEPGTGDGTGVEMSA